MQDLPTTRWSLVLRAGDRTLPGSEEALADLCRTYWYPVYAFVRKKTGDPERAKDAAQSFFAALLEKDFLRRADPERGRFRALLLTMVRRFLIDEWKKESARKRGGDRVLLSLDYEEGESRYQREPADPLTPERVFERRWAAVLLDRVLDRLAASYRDEGKGELFETLKPALVGVAGHGAAGGFARTLDMTPNAVRTALHRLRRRYRALLEEEVLHTVEDPALVEEEIHHLLSVFATDR